MAHTDSSLDTRENVGSDFSENQLRAAQVRAWEVIDEVAAQIRPGMTEKEALAILKEAYSDSEKIWHPPQIRFGQNTTKAFGQPGEPNVVLQENDLYFLDIGPVYHGYESDVGRTIVVGNDPEMKRLADDAKVVFDLVRDHWKETGKSGLALYEFAQQKASDRGWKLSLEGASGHRISDFPHAVHFRGKLRTFDKTPTANRWILEIHLFHPTKQLGAFFEDIL